MRVRTAKRKKKAEDAGGGDLRFNRESKECVGLGSWKWVRRRKLSFYSRVHDRFNKSGGGLGEREAERIEMKWMKIDGWGILWFS